MDAFFVAVELLRRPELRGKPVIVATGTDPTARGVVMTASYEARKYGVHSALPLAIAHRRCPQAVLIPRDIELYRRASKRVMEILREYSDLVEVAGLDEAYLDLSGSPAPKARARELKRRMRAETRLSCSVGIAPNKLMAKIASDLEKPDGLCVLDSDRWLKAVGERPAALLPGVGPRTEERLLALGIRTVEDLAHDGYVGRTVTMKIRLRPFRTHTRSRTLPEPTCDVGAIREVARELLDGFELDAPVRLLGVGVAGLTRPADAAEEKRAAAGSDPQPLALDVTPTSS